MNIWGTTLSDVWDGRDSVSSASYELEHDDAEGQRRTLVPYRVRNGIVIAVCVVSTAAMLYR